VRVRACCFAWPATLLIKFAWPVTKIIWSVMGF